LRIQKPEKLGVITIAFNSSKEVGTGNVTRCAFEIAKELPDKIKISFSTMPEITAINAPGINFNFFKRNFIPSD
jgi:hypothetical protein